MTTVEKRRSSRKSHRKRNDGGYSDTETDREVSSLTDRAFRSLCIGDEAVYNDSDLSASPCAQRGRQLAISHNVQEREDRERQELKRTAHESFSLRVQQYGQDWNYRGMYGAAIHKDQQWGAVGTQGRLSATFQQSFVEAPQQECPSRELSLYSNGTAEVSSQPHRSRSRVSSLVQAFNSEGQRDEAVYNNETSWDKSALMSIERELSEFSSYPQNMNSGYFPSAGLFSSQNYYSSEVAAISQMNSASSFMRSTHSNYNSNFFIHSEFSPFKVWRDQNRFPFHGGQVSGFVPCSEFQKWYETPMYKELSLQPQQHPSMFSDQGYHRNTFAPAVPMNPQRSTSASSMMQRASAVEKRCESAGHYRKRAQSTGANRLAPQRPSTASPSGEMSRQVRDTISSVKSLQQRIKMMAEQNLETQSQGGFYNSNYLSPNGPIVPNMVSSNPYTAPYQMQKSPVYAPQEPQQFLQAHSPPPVEHAPVRAESRGATPDIKASSYKSRAASLLYNLKDNRKRVKATYSPSKFKSMDTQEKYKQEPKDFVIDVPEFPGNELLNSTDERLEVGQYGYQNLQYTQNSLSEFEGSIDRNRLNIPQFGYQGHNQGMLQYPQNAQYSQHEFVNPTNKSISLNVPQYGYQARSPGMLRNSQQMENSQHKFVNHPDDRGNRLEAGPYGYQGHSPRMLQNAQFPQNSQHMPNSQQLYPGQNPSEYYRAPHHGFTGYTPEHYASNKLANGQNPYENISSFTPYTQGMSDTGEGDYVNRLGQNAAAEMQRFSALGQSRDYVSKDNSRQQFNEAASREFTGVDRYNQRKENKYDYNNVYSQDMWGQTNSQEIQRPGIPLAQNYQNINAYQRTNAMDNVQSYNYEHKLIENYGARPHGAVASTDSNQGPQYPPPHPANAGNPGYAQHNTQQLPGTYRDIYAPQTSHECNKENKMKENYAPQDNRKYYDQESKKQTIISSQGGAPIATEELGQRKETVIKDNGMKGMQLKETGHFENGKQEEKAEQEQVKEMSTRDQCTNEKVSLQHKVPRDKLNEIKIAEDRPKVKPYQHKEEFEDDMFAKYRSDKVLPIAEKQTKSPEEKSSSAPAELQEVTDEQGHVVETKLQRLDTEQQLRVRHANTEELKEEAIKCELAVSSEEARIEQVKPEPSRKERVITDRANETQARAQHVERKVGEERQGEERSEAKQAVTEPITEDTKSEEKKEKEVVLKDETPIIEIQTSKQEKNYNEATDSNVINEPPVSKSKNTEKAENHATNVNDAQKSSSKSEPKQPVICEPDKVEQTKAEFVKTKAELKENMKGETKGHKDEEHFDQVNGNSLVSSKEPQVAHKGLDNANRGADDYERIREKYGYNQGADKNKTSITGKVSEQPTLPNTNEKDEIIENTVDSKLESKNESTNSELVSDTTDNEKTKNTLHDDPTESQYVYSESSKDFKLSVASDVVDHDFKKQDAPIEKAEKSDDSQQRNKHVLDDECKLSKSNLPDSTDKGRVVKNDSSQVKDVLVEKVDKVDISQLKDAKQAIVERKQKSSDQNPGSSKETSLKGLTHKDKAQTKHEIMASKIKAHAEKEISAIKEGFATRDGLKNPTKSLAISQNVNIRQKPPSQEVFKKQERTLNGDTSKVQSPSATKTATGQQQVQAATETSVSKTIKIAEKPSTLKDKKLRCSSPTDDKPKHQDKPSKQDKLDKEDNTDLPENTAPSLQLVFGQSAAQNDTLKIMGIMVTVRERQPFESKGDENKGIQELSAKCPDTETNTGGESNISKLSEKAVAPQVTEEQDYNESNNSKSEMDSKTALESTEKNLIDCTTAKMESSLPIDRPQSETQLSSHLAEKVVSPAVTVPAKNKVLAATQPVPNKQDIISEETKDYANRAPNPARETTDAKDQENITGLRTKQDLDSTIDINRVTSVPSTSKNEETQRDNLHIDSIAIRVVPVTEEVITTGIISSGSVTAREISSIVSNHHQESSSSNDDVQKVLSSVRKQAQLLKNSRPNQQTINNTTSKNIENDQSKEVNNTLDEITRPPIEEGYFQVEKRNIEPQNNSVSVGQTPKAVSQERECLKSLSNSDTGSNQSLKEESHTEIRKSSSANMHDLNTKTSKHTSNPINDESHKDEKQGIAHSHHTRRHHMAKDRQRSLSNTQDGTDRKVEVTSKPKVPMPEISALADYARLKVIVSKDNEDNLQELPPNKKEGFFPLIQSRHSKRPVFTLDSQEDVVKEKPSQNQSDASVKVNKELKPVVFPITEKQHQRTGMFKMGDKEGATDNSITGIQENIKEQTTQDKTNNVHHAEKKVKHMLEKSKATQAEEEKKATQREEEQRAREREAITAQIRERRMKQREPERQEDSKNKVADQHISERDEPQKKTQTEEQKLLEEQQKSSSLKEDRKSTQEENLRMEQEDHQTKAPIKQEQLNRHIIEKHQGKADEQKKKDISDDQQREGAQIEQQRKSFFLELQRRAALEEQQRTAQIEEQKAKAAKEEHLKKAVLEENTRKANEELRKTEENNRAILEEKQRKAAQIGEQRQWLQDEQQKKRAALEEQQRKAAAEEQLKKSALTEQQRRTSAANEQQRKSVLTEEQRRQAAHEEHTRKREEQQRRFTLESQEELKKKAALEEQQRRAAQKDQQRKMAEEDQKRKAAIIEEQNKRSALEEQQRKAAAEEQQRKAALIEEQKRKLAADEQRKVALKEQQRRVAEEERQRKAAEEQKRQAVLIDEQKRQAAHEEQLRKIEEEKQQRQAAIIEEQKKRAALEEEHRKAALKEEQRRAALEEQQRNAKMIEEQRRKAAIEEEQRKAAEEQQRKAALIEEKRRQAAHEEQLRKMEEEKRQRQAAIIEEQKKRAALEEEQRQKVSIEEEQRKAAEEQQRKAALIEEKRRQAAHEEQLRKMEEEEQRKSAIIEEQKKRAALEEEQRQKAAIEEEQRTAAEEQQRKAALIEEKRRQAAHEEQLRQMVLKEQQRKNALIEEQKKRAAFEEQQRRFAIEEQQRKTAQEQQKQNAALEEQRRKMAEEEQLRKAMQIEEQKKRDALEEQQRKNKMEEEEQRKKAALEEQKKVAEEQRKAAIIEEQIRQAAHKEQLRKMAEEEQQREAAIAEEQKKRVLIEEQQRRLALEEQQRKAAQEEQKQKAALEEQQRKRAEEELQRKAMQIEEQKKIDALEEQQRKNKMAEEEQQRKAAIEEQRKAVEEQRKAAIIEEQRRQAAHKEQLRKMAEEEEQRKAMQIEEQKKRYTLEEQQRKNKMAEEEQQRKAAIEEQRRQAAHKEQLRKMAEEEQQRKAMQIEEQKKRYALEEQQRKNKMAEEEQQRKAAIEEQRRQAAHKEQLRKMAEEEQQREAAIIQEQKKRVLIEEQQRRSALEEQQKKAAQEQKAALAEQQRAAQKQQQRQMAEEERQRKVAIIEEQKNRTALEEQQRKAAVIEERKRRAALEEEQQRRTAASIEEQKRKAAMIERQNRTREEEDETRLSIIREERIRRQIEEAREAQIEQERKRQKDQHKTEQSSRAGQAETAETEEQKNLFEKTEALQYYSLTSAKVEKLSPSQKRNSTIEPDTAEDSRRPLAPVSPAPSLPRSSAASPAFGTKPSMFKVKDNTVRGSSLTKSIKPRFHKNFGEEFRVGSPMERAMEKNEEDQGVLRYNAGTPVYPEKSPSTPLPEHRPFSRRSLALDEEDCRSVISNMSDLESFATSAADLADIRALYDSDRPESACSFSSDVSRSLGKPPVVPPKSEKALRRAKRLATRRIKKELTKGVTEDSYETSTSEVANADAVASPHFAPPISIAHAPPAGSSVPSSHSHQHSFQATPHATAPVSLPTASPHTSALVSTPQVPSSPTHHSAPKPVTQYQVESGFPQSYTQKRVMQDVGSGQYYVVDVPVEVKTKTFFDPETGKYVQLNVRESNRNAPQRQPLQAYPQSHLKPKTHAKPQSTPSANAHYQDYHSYPKGYQSGPTSSSAPVYQSVTPETIPQDKHPVRSNMTYQDGGNDKEYGYIPDKTPYMDTVKPTDKAHNVVYRTHGSQRAQSEGDGRVSNSRRGSRDIITMSELEDFMEVSDW